ncbi:MAG: glycosyltransferase [Balneolaceae bacterium]
MVSTPSISILLTPHLHAEDLESLIHALAGFQRLKPEVLLTTSRDDRQARARAGELASLLPDGQCRLLSANPAAGRSLHLNRALNEASGEYVWAPLHADRLHEELLTDTLIRCFGQPAYFWLMDAPLPDNPEAWLEMAKEGGLPNDSRWLWNRSLIDPGDFWFHPAVDDAVGAELALRLSENARAMSTDAFFVVRRKSAPPTSPAVLRELLFSLIRLSGNDAVKRERWYRELEELSLRQPTAEEPESLLEQAKNLSENDPRTALKRIDQALRRHPEDIEAIRFKIHLLEKLRRHVEAAELKHSIAPPGKGSKGKEQQPDLFSLPLPKRESVKRDEPAKEGTESTNGKPVQLSILIPTSGDGKPLLERCLSHLIDTGLFEKAVAELVLIDNASIDNTFDYLEQLQEQKPVPLKVITNHRNLGFGAAVNRGLEAASGEWILVMHNDLFPEADCIPELIRTLEQDSDLGAAGPVVDKCDHPEQIKQPDGNGDDKPVPAETLDSCCILIRAQSGVRFDETYGLAFFEDADICNQIRQQGLGLAIAPNARATHIHRATTEAMGLHLEPEFWWRNERYFNRKWDREPTNKVELSSTDDLDKLLELPLPQDLLHPDSFWLESLRNHLTDVIRTRILREEQEEETLIRLTALALAADQRDLLRHLEQRIEKFELPAQLIRDLIRYYYQRSIWSRCLHYLSRSGRDDPFYDLYRLRIAVSEKSGEDAADLLNGLISKFPCHPELYKLAGDVHKMTGDEEEARSFHTLAARLDPGLVTGEEEAFDLRH